MGKKNIILGINHGGHDTSSCIGVNGEIVYASEQERFDGVKHSRNFPIDSINDGLKKAQIKIQDIDEIVLTANHHDIIRNQYLKPALEDNERIKFLINDIEKIKTFYNFKENIRKILNFKKEITEFRHHLCHLASTYYPSGFNDALILSNDGMGEYESGMLGCGSRGRIKILKNGPNYPNSLGLIYSAITYYLGWKNHCDEGIIMGLAPFGDYKKKINKSNLTYIDAFRDIIKDNSFLDYTINKKWISYHQQRNTWVSEYFYKIFGKKRNYKDKIEDRHKNIASALQKRLEEVVLKDLFRAKKKYKFNKLCIAGGVGLNCSLNGKIEDSKIFKEIFVQPASGDAGVALGAVYLAFARNNKNYLKVKPRIDHYLGSEFKKKEIKTVILKKKVKYLETNDIFNEGAKLLEKGKIIAWFQGSSEFGPRALGNRSILCKPYPSKMKDYLNKRVKFRESFRPFAPAILEDKCGEFFNIKQSSPHMLIATTVKKNKKKMIPAVVHVDDTCRVQTVSEKSNLKFFKLINSFYKLTKCPVVLNTSFNVKGQPIVNTPEEAIETFLNTRIDYLIIDNFIIKK